MKKTTLMMTVKRDDCNCSTKCIENKIRRFFLPFEESSRCSARDFRAGRQNWKTFQESKHPAVIDGVV